MIYIDTSVLVALHLAEEHSERAERWYIKCKQTLITSVWSITEFASALSIKQRTAQINAGEAREVWARFEQQCNSELQLLAVEPPAFHRAALLAMNMESKLRSGDALHLACALQAKALAMASFDQALTANARRYKLKPAL
jgi:uncharacterized protein